MKIFNRVADIVEKIVPDGDKKKELTAEIQKVMQEELSDRHNVDMSSKSWLSKNIRPLTLLILLLLFIGCTFWLILPNEKYKVVAGLLEWVCAFYFGSRFGEKTNITKMFKK